MAGRDIQIIIFKGHGEAPMESCSFLFTWSFFLRCGRSFSMKVMGTIPILRRLSYIMVYCEPSVSY